MNVSDLKGKTIGFLASGGLDSCTITHWLTQNGVKVVSFTADLAQPDETDFSSIEKRMRTCGAVDFVALPLQKEMAAAGLKGIQTQACYEGRYWNTTGIGRQVTTKGAIPEVMKRKIPVLAHGATGRGNDQVRFQLITNMTEPSLQVYAPWRDQVFLDRFGGRAQMIDYCEQYGLPIKATRDKPYSTDANLLGLTHESGKLESLQSPASVVTPEFGVWAKDAPDKEEKFSVRFEKGVPVKINGDNVDVLGAFLLANKIGGRNGIGIGEHLVENRFVGIKSRGVYEQPGMELLGKCYEYLLQLVLDARAMEFFKYISILSARQMYHGYCNDLASRMIYKAVEETAALATGTIEVSLYKGIVSYVSSSDTPYCLYSLDSSMEKEGSFDHKDSEGFLGVLGVHARALAKTGQTGK